MSTGAHSVFPFDAETLPSYLALLAPLYRERARQHLTEIQELAAACSSTLAGPLNASALLVLSNALARSHDDFRAALTSMAHAASSAGAA